MVIGWFNIVGRRSSTSATMLLWELRKYRYCMHLATSLLYQVHAVTSRNKWFKSCGTSRKITMRTPNHLCLLTYMRIIPMCLIKFEYYIPIINEFNQLLLYWGEGWLVFLDLWSGQKLWWYWYLTPVVNFHEVRGAQLAKSTLLTSTLGLLVSFQIFYGLFRF